MKVKSSETDDFLLRSHMWKFTAEEKKRDTSYQRGEFRGNKTWSPGDEQQTIWSHFHFCSSALKVWHKDASQGSRRKRQSEEAELTDEERLQRTYGVSLGYECGLARLFEDPETEQLYTMR